MDAELERFGAMSLPALGAAVMAAGFGSDGPGGPGKPGTLEAPAITTERVGVSDIARRMTPAYLAKGTTTEQGMRFGALVAEGLQILERGLLVRVSWQGGQANWVATRYGRSVLAQDSVQRVLDGGGP
jgi:hypothetical protein